MWIIQWAKSSTWRNEFDMPIRNFARVTGAVYRGAFPSEEGYRALVAKLGVRRVLSLTDRAADDESAKALRAGMRGWWHIPFHDREAPDPVLVREWLAHVRTATPEDPVYTHCMGGRHRTGVLIAVLRVTDQGWTKQEAFREMLRYGWYDARGHRPLREWFERDFDPADFAATAPADKEIPTKERS
ncbi:MAG TPA: hypothetical protein VD968_18250 [Pyrinomonadaceae bacterium]|nr:hypothetical protein [Pyrinomonadaceae bacterium]